MENHIFKGVSTQMGMISGSSALSPVRSPARSAMLSVHVVATLFPLAVLAAPASAADLSWQGAPDQDFANPVGWAPSQTPASGDNVTITISESVVRASIAVNSIAISNNGVLNIQNGTVSASGGTVLTGAATLSVQESGTLLSPVSASGGTITNSGTISSINVAQPATVENNGTILSVVSAATVTNNATGVVQTMVNSGTFTNNGQVATLDTSGSFTNNGSGVVSGQLNATGGSVINNGTLGSSAVGAGANLVNNVDATVGDVVSQGEVTNNGSISSVRTSNRFSNNTNGVVTGDTVVTAGEAANSGRLSLTTVTGDATLTNNATGNITEVNNSGTLRNDGAIAALTSTSGQAVNNAGGTITGVAAISGGTFITDGAVSSLSVTGGEAIVNGTGSVTQSATLNGGRLTNNGAVAATIVGSTGSLINNRDASIASIQNSGSVLNDGTVQSLNNTGGSFVNNATGTVQGSTVVSGGSVVNNGTLAATDVQDGGSFVNNDAATVASVVNAGQSANYGTIVDVTNTGGTFDNAGSIQSASISGGTLLNRGSVTGTLDVSAGGVVSGFGSVGTLALGNGAGVSPGVGLGTLRVTNNLQFNLGSYYALDVTADGQSDQVVVQGNTVLNGGSLRVLAASGRYSTDTSYTILTSAGGVTGAFTEATSNLAFLDPTLSYSADDVSLRFERNAVQFASVATTRNQASVARALETLPATNAAVGAVLSSTRDTAGLGFDQLSGEIFSSTATALIEDSHLIRDAATERLRVSSGSQDPAVWSRGIGEWGDIDGNGNASGIDRDTRGILFGGDTTLANPLASAGFPESFRLGALFGYSRSNVDGDVSRSSVESDNYHVGFYGGTEWGNLSYRSGLAYSFHDVQANRSIAFAGFGDSTSASYDASTFQSFGELAYRYNLDTVTLEPFAALANVRLHTDGFMEQGADGRLRVGSESTNTTFTTVGLRASTPLDMIGPQASLSGTLGWCHAFGDIETVGTRSFVGSDSFLIAGVPIAKNAALIEAGFDYAVNDKATLGLSYHGQFGDGTSSNGAKINFALKF